MSFLYPSFLWALAVLSIPVIIHLFNFKRTTRVYFSNTRFLKKVKESTTAKRKLKHYLILLSRLLFLFFLVITFCQPIIPAQEEAVNHRNVVFYLDNSQSMSIRGGDKQNVLDAGIDFIQQIVDAFPADARYRLVTNDFAPFSNSLKSKQETLELLTQLRLSPISRSMEEVLDRIRQSHDDRNPEIFYISDFQKSTTGLVNNDVLKDTTVRLHLVPMVQEASSNVSVDSVYLDNPFAAGGEKNVLRIRLRNNGTESEDQLQVKLTINSIQAGTASISIAAGGVGETSFDLTTGLSGLNKAEISFNDFPVLFDNQFFVALNFTDKIRVIEIKNTAASTPIEKVFGNTNVFTYRGFTEDNFNYSLLKEADLVVVNGLQDIGAALGAALREYLNNNNTLFIAPGAAVDVASYQAFLQIGSLGMASKREMAELDRPEFSNPFFENVFEERSASLVMPKAIPLLDWGVDRSAILKFKNETAFMSRFDQGGSIYLLAAPLETAFTDFYNNAIFVPVMYRVAASGRKATNKLYYTLAENFINLRMDSVNADTQVRLINEEEIIPDQRIVGDRLFMDIPKFTMKAGFYNVVAGSDTVNVIAFNLEKAESMLDQYNVTDIKTALGTGDNITIFDSAKAGAFSNEIKERYLGTPLWKYALILALLFLAVEILLIRFLK
ncbi:MAG TPA: BatA domain-containing protein [Ohtaekwangia sp.]|nr:BatA domain-containing protein [Ohtaekwangia sp.]